MTDTKSLDTQRYARMVVAMNAAGEFSIAVLPVHFDYYGEHYINIFQFHSDGTKDKGPISVYMGSLNLPYPQIAYAPNGELVVGYRDERFFNPPLHFS